MYLYGSFRKLGVPYLGVLIIRTLLFRVLYLDLLFSETPISFSGFRVWGRGQESSFSGLRFMNHNTVNPRKLEHGFRRIGARIPYTLA